MTRTYLSSEASTSGGEVDLSDGRGGIRWDVWTGVPGGQEQPELFIVVNHFVSYLHNVPWP